MEPIYGDPKTPISTTHREPCPDCGTPMVTLNEYLEDRKRKIRDLEERIRVADKILASAEEDIRDGDDTGGFETEFASELTIRQEIAARCLQGLIAAKYAPASFMSAEQLYRSTAREAVAYADALIAELAATKE